MNGILDSQTPGNEWQAVPQPMSYQSIQEGHFTTREPRRRSNRGYYENQMPQAAVEYGASINQITKHYVLPKDSSVIDFLREHRPIPQLLLEALPYLKKHFGANAVVSLKAPIDEAGFQDLYGVVMWPGSARDATVALGKFEDDWWIANSHSASGGLNFTYELV